MRRNFATYFKDFEHVKFDKNHLAKSICWYPSAGDDFRHIAYLEKANLKSGYTSTSHIYIFTDYYLPANDRIGIDVFKTGTVLFETNTATDSTQLKILYTTELNLKTFNVCPFFSKGQFEDRGLFYGDGDHYSNKVYFLLTELSIFQNGRSIKVQIPCFYFTHENCNFLVDFLLHNQLCVDTLVHIQDGGGTMGGSHLNMDFIYQFQKLLKIKQVITDKSVNTKEFHYDARALMMDYLDYSNDFNEARKGHLLHGLQDHNWIDNPLLNWIEEKIAKSYYGETLYNSTERCYYLWKKKNQIK